MDRDSFPFYCELCSVGMMTREGYEVHMLGKRHQERMLPPDKRPGAAAASASTTSGAGGSDEPELVKSDFVLLRRMACQSRELLEPLGSRVLNYADLPGGCCVALFDQLDSGQWDDTYRQLSARCIACPVYIQNGVGGNCQPVDKRRLNFVFLYNLPEKLTPADVADVAAGGRISINDVRIVERLGDARAAFVRMPSETGGGAADRTEVINRLSSSPAGFSVFELWAPTEALESPAPTPPPAPSSQLQPQAQPMMMMFNQPPHMNYPQPMLAFQQAQYPPHPAQFMPFPVSVPPPFWNAMPPAAMFGQHQFNYPTPPIASTMMTQSAYSASIQQQAAASTAWQQRHSNRSHHQQQHRYLPPEPAARWVDAPQPDEDASRDRRRSRSRRNSDKRSSSRTRRSRSRSERQLRKKSRSPNDSRRRHRRERDDHRSASRDDRSSRSRRRSDRSSSRTESRRQRRDERSDSGRSSSRHRHGDKSKSPNRRSSSRHRLGKSTSRRSASHKRSAEPANGPHSSPKPRPDKESPVEKKLRNECNKEQTSDSNLFLLGLKMIQQADTLNRQPNIGAVGTASSTVSKSSDSWYISSGLEAYYVVSGFPRYADCIRLSSRLQVILFNDCQPICYVAIHPATGSKMAVIAPTSGKTLLKPRLMEIAQFLAGSAAKKRKKQQSVEDEVILYAGEETDEFEVVWEKELPVTVDSDATNSRSDGIPDADAEFHIESEAESTESNQLTEADPNPKSVSTATTQEGNKLKPDEHLVEAAEDSNPVGGSSVQSNPAAKGSTNIAEVADLNNKTVESDENAELADSMETVDEVISVADPNLSTVELAAESVGDEIAASVKEAEMVESTKAISSVIVESQNAAGAPWSDQIQNPADESKKLNLQTASESTDPLATEADEVSSINLIVREVVDSLLESVVRLIESDSIVEANNAEEKSVSAAESAATSKPISDPTGNTLCLREYSTVTCHEFASSLPDRFLFWPTKGQAPFLLLWNLPTRLPLSQLISSLRELIPQLRSVHVPRDPLDSNRNCGYCVVRFQGETDEAFSHCLAARDNVRTFGRKNRRRLGNRATWQTQLRAIPAQMREICHVPPFSFPCHNLITWVASVEPSTERCVIDRSPFACPCHPVCEELAPDQQKFVQFAKLVQQARAAYPVETVRANLRAYLDTVIYR